MPKDNLFYVLSGPLFITLLLQFALRRFLFDDISKQYLADIKEYQRQKVEIATALQNGNVSENIANYKKSKTKNL